MKQTPSPSFEPIDNLKSANDLEQKNKLSINLIKTQALIEVCLEAVINTEPVQATRLRNIETGLFNIQKALSDNNIDRKSKSKLEFFLAQFNETASKEYSMENFNEVMDLIEKLENFISAIHAQIVANILEKSNTFYNSDNLML
jgi:hypothetical protein